MEYAEFYQISRSFYNVSLEGAEAGKFQTIWSTMCSKTIWHALFNQMLFHLHRVSHKMCIQSSILLIGSYSYQEA